MFNILKKKDETAKTVTTYSIDELGLECLSDFLSGYDLGYNTLYASDFDLDISYLKGVSSTINDNRRMIEIIRKLTELKGILDISITKSESGIKINELESKDEN